MQRDAEFLVLEDRRFEIHLQAGNSRGPVHEHTRAAQPAIGHGREGIVFVPNPGGAFLHHVQLAEADIIELALRSYDPQMNLVEIVHAAEISLLVAPPIGGSLEGDRLPPLHIRNHIGTDRDLRLMTHDRINRNVQHGDALCPGASKRRAGRRRDRAYREPRRNVPPHRRQQQRQKRQHLRPERRPGVAHRRECAGLGGVCPVRYVARVFNPCGDVLIAFE